MKEGWQKLKGKLAETVRFIQFVYQHFFEDDCTYIASALAFTSLLAVVPLMSVGLSILSSFPMIQNLSVPIQDFIFENFVPATGKVVQGYLQQFSAQVSHLSSIGIIFLFVTAILLMVTIERGMNKIWRVKRSREGVAAFLLYWAILSLAPILLGLSMAATSYVFSMPMIREHHTPAVLLRYAPFFLSLFAYTFLFVVVPNCRVKIRYGFWGALFSATLFELAKFGFAYYLTRYNTYQLLYGAFATIPIFFVWVYWVWIITLLGAEISYALSVYYKRRTGPEIDGFSHALIWLHSLWKAQQNGKGMSVTHLVESSEQPFTVDVGDMLSLLIRKNLIHMAEDDNYRLSRDLHHFSLYQLHQLLPYRLPSVEELEQIVTEKNTHWKAVLTEHDQRLSQMLAVSLGDLFCKDQPANHQL